MTLTPQQKTILRMVIDYSGAAAFVIAYIFTHDFQKATWWLVGLSALALATGFALERRVAPLPLIYGGAALVFGALTLKFHDPIFIAMKTTVIDLLLGTALLVGRAVGKSPIKMLVGDSLKLSDDGWSKLTFRFGLFFLALSVLNVIVWFSLPHDVWVLFRMPGLLILSFLFSFTQIPMMMKEAKAFEAAAVVVDSQQ